MGEGLFALVTGTSSGLGYEMAQYLLEEGYSVIGVSRSPIESDCGMWLISCHSVAPTRLIAPVRRDEFCNNRSMLRRADSPSITPFIMMVTP